MSTTDGLRLRFRRDGEFFPILRAHFVTTSAILDQAGFPSAGLIAPARKSKPKVSEKKETPWKVVVLDDPVNLMEYVTRTFMKIFSYPRERAERHMMEVHQNGRSIVWSGKKELAEMFVQQLHQALLKAKLEKDEV